MARITKFTVYVDKSVMDKPDALYDAVFKHMVRKEEEAQKNGKTICGFPVRKKFTAGFMKTHESKQVAYIDTWALIRDAETFPLRHNKKTGKAPVAKKAEITTATARPEPSEEKSDGK